MDNKYSNAAVSTVTVNRHEVAKPTNNLYMAIVIIAKRAEQIMVEMKEEMNEKLEEFQSYQDTLQEIFENEEQIEVSKYYEKLPKPWALALQEWLEGKISWRFEDDDRATKDSIF